MQIITHRINTIEQLKKIPQQYGVEIDIRETSGQLILNHEAFGKGDLLEEYVKNYQHACIIFNIKEAGIEDTIIQMAKKYNIEDYFLLDVEFPYLYRAARQGVRKIAIRYSEDECIETVLKYKGMVDWVWIDTNTKLPLTKKVIQQLEGFKTCLVCPDRWGRPQDIAVYRKKIKKLNFKLDAVMTSFATIPAWEK